MIIAHAAREGGNDSYSSHFHKCSSRTKVLLSSIFFIADSVVNGYFTMAQASSFSEGGALQDNSATACHPASFAG
jgi:hypothetical protein